MELLFIIAVILIAFIPILYRINKRIYETEEEIKHLKKKIKKKYESV